MALFSDRPDLLFPQQQPDSGDGIAAVPLSLPLKGPVLSASLAGDCYLPVWEPNLAYSLDGF